MSSLCVYLFLIFGRLLQLAASSIDYFLSDNFKARAEALIAKYKTPGLAIAITRNERIESRAFGLACLDPPVPCTPDTLFDIASASKSMTAASVALLVENDKHTEVRWDAVMSEVLPGDFVMSTEQLTRATTVDDMVSHRSGMPTHDFSYLGFLSKSPDTPDFVTRNLRNLPVCAPLRTRYMYNNMMYTVAAHLVQKKTGLNFSDFLQTNFFGPLDMPSSSLQPSRAVARGFADRMAEGYTWAPKEGRLVPVPMIECPDSDGAGSIITSVNDYIKWVRAMLHHQGPVTDAVYSGLLRGRTITAPKGENLPPYSSPGLYERTDFRDIFSDSRIIQVSQRPVARSQLYFLQSSSQLSRIAISAGSVPSVGGDGAEPHCPLEHTAPRHGLSRSLPSRLA